jgi:hypothetical protein
LDEWTACVAQETRRLFPVFRYDPGNYENSEAYYRVLVMVTMLQRDLGVRFNPDRVLNPNFSDSRDLFLHGLLTGDRTGTCVSIPVLYAAVGRRLGYPIRLVLAKAHVFARWDDGQTGERFNIEATGPGLNVFPDEYYHAWPVPLTADDLASGQYLQSLTAEQELALFVATRGHCLEDTGRLEEACEVYAEACRLDPGSSYHRACLGGAEGRLLWRRFAPCPVAGTPLTHTTGPAGRPSSQAAAAAQSRCVKEGEPCTARHSAGGCSKIPQNTWTG